ncbi:MAG: HNH endonuclease [Acidobacteria bacterium]|nr:HNH endonuclease [Acidobacteriota bacterium]
MQETLHDYGKAYSEIVKLALSGNCDEAKAMLAKIPGQPNPIVRVSSHGVPKLSQVIVFERDGFRCRYCGRCVVMPPVLRLLSICFVEVFPYHLHGKMDVSHLAFWRDIASCDHLIPVARGGISEVENLVTACYMCNSIKQNWLVDELRWAVRPAPVGSSWDGLCSQYAGLLEMAKECSDGADLPYFRDWSSAVRRLQ